MKKLNVDLENCYRIKKLQAQFDFPHHRAYASYAPNGAKKILLSRTFKDLADATTSKDRIFPGRVCCRKITDEEYVDLPKESFVVIRAYNEDFGNTEKTSTVLVDGKLRKEYDGLHIGINNSKAIYLMALKEQSGSKEDLGREISSTCTKSAANFYRTLIRIKDEPLALFGAPFTDVHCDTQFDEKVPSFLCTKYFKAAIDS